MPVTPTNQEVQFNRGLKSNLPEEKVPGTLSIATDTGEAFLDDTSTNRVQIKDTTKVSKSGDTMTGTLNMSSHKITTVADPTAATDAANLRSVQQQIKNNRYSGGTSINVDNEELTISHRNIGTAGTVGPAGDLEPSHGGIIQVPSITTDAQGHVTSKQNRTITLPSVISDDQVKEAVNNYLEENPVSGMTAEQEQQLNQNTLDVSDLKRALEQKGLPAGGTTGQVLAKKTDNDYDVEWKDEKTGTGLSAEAIDKLEEVGNYLVYTTADGGSKWMELISILRNSSSGGGSGETVTLQSISATYAGGEVAVGTSLDSLTGITVTAHYSDGSTETITGYALSGEIVEGKNTITVSYGGKTTTFTVTGVAESGGEEVAVTDLDSGNMKWYSDGGDTLLQQMAKAKSYTGVFEEETEVQVAVIVNETQYSAFYIGAYDGTDTATGYYAKNFEISGYPSAGKTYTTTYTVPSGYGVIVGGWSVKGNVTVKVVKIGV